MQKRIVRLVQRDSVVWEIGIQNLHDRKFIHVVQRDECSETFLQLVAFVFGIVVLYY